MRTGVLLATVVLVVTACSDDAGKPSKDVAPVPAGLESGCPAPETALRFPEGDLPSGATAVRLCAGVPAGMTMRAVPPLDALVTDVDRVIEVVNDLEAPRGQSGEQGFCTSDGGADLAYWFGYPDGDWRAVGLGAYGCRILQVGQDMTRDEGTAVASAFAEALAAQREASTPPAHHDQAVCEWLAPHARFSPLPGQPVELRTAVLCRNTGRYRVRARQVPADLIDRINKGLMARPPAADCPEPREVMTLEGWTVWGDRQIYFVESCGWVTASRGAGLTQAGETEDRRSMDPDLLADLLVLPEGPVIDVRKQ